MKSDTFTLVPISNIHIGFRYRKDLGDLSPLERSISAVGLLQPIGLTPDNALIFGERRLRACEALGHKTIKAHVLCLDSFLRGEHDENAADIRKDLTNSEKLAIAEAVKAELGDRRGRPGKGGEIPTITEKGKTRDIAAKAAGFKSTDHMRSAEIVEAKCHKDIQDAVDDKTVTVSDAAAIANEPMPIQEAAMKKVLFQEVPTLVAAVKLVREENEDAGIEEEPILDMLDNPVPEHLMMYVEDNLLFQEIQEDVKAVRVKLCDLDRRPTASHRKTGLWQLKCREIEEAMRVERFGFGCPACGGNGPKSCACCQGRKWFVAGDREKVDVKQFKKRAS